MARRLTRNTRQAVLAGVAAGFADHFDLDPVLVRLAFIFLCFFGGTGIALYLVAWVLMPRDVDRAPPDGASTDSTAGEDAGSDGLSPAERVARGAAEAGERVVDTVRRRFPEASGRGRLVAGVLLIGLGILFLVDHFLPVVHWWWIWDLWPLALIGVGVLILVNARRQGQG